MLKLKYALIIQSQHQAACNFLIVSGKIDHVKLLQLKRWRYEHHQCAIAAHRTWQAPRLDPYTQLRYIFPHICKMWETVVFGFSYFSALGPKDWCDGLYKIEVRDNYEQLRLTSWTGQLHATSNFRKFSWLKSFKHLRRRLHIAYILYLPWHKF
jgi:hypothetical protein